MSSHRVILDRAGIEALYNGAVVLDNVGDVMEKYAGYWSVTNHSEDAYTNEDIQLPARVLIESWDR